MAYLLAMPYIVLFIAATLFLILGYFRYTRAVLPLKQYGGFPLPGFPGPRGLVGRLDGIGRRHRDISRGRQPRPLKDGNIILPDHWEGSMTTGRMAMVAHTWALCQLAEDDPQGARVRENALLRTNILSFFAFLIALALIFVKRIDVRTAFMIVAGIWAFLSFIAIPTQYREWKARDLARERLKEAGLWPQYGRDRTALDACLTAMLWCRVAGFRRVVPR